MTNAECHTYVFAHSDEFDPEKNADAARCRELTEQHSAIMAWLNNAEFVVGRPESPVERFIRRVEEILHPKPELDFQI